MVEEKVVIRKVWRSELLRLLLLLITALAAPVLSALFPRSIVTGELFPIGNDMLYLSLPLWWLVPAFLFIEVAWRIYNVRYVVDEAGIESWTGILSLRQQITHVRHEDVRSIETDQSVLERILDVGEVQISTAATGGVEVLFCGVPSPKKLQNWLQAKRDRVQKKVSQGRRRTVDGTSSMAVSSVLSDIDTTGNSTVSVRDTSSAPRG